MSLLVAKTSCSVLENAYDMAAELVTEKLAACVQISAPITSVYMWDGKLETELEYVLEIKTLPEKKEALKHYIAQNHPYEIPELTLVLLESSKEYLVWVKSELEEN